MYLRETRRTNKDGSVVSYLQLAHNERHPKTGASTGLSAAWQQREDQQHPHLAPSHIVPTMIQAGEFALTHAPSCAIVFNVQYLPSMVDDDMTGRAVAREIEEYIGTVVADDPWLREHPLAWEH
jgi:hypothetical protein